MKDNIYYFSSSYILHKLEKKYAFLPIRNNIIELSKIIFVSPLIAKIYKDFKKTTFSDIDILDLLYTKFPEENKQNINNEWYKARRELVNSNIILIQ